MSAASLPALSRGEVDEAVSAERRRLLDAFGHLTDDQWATTSLCAAWSVRDVVAHLTTTTRSGPLRVLSLGPRGLGAAVLQWLLDSIRAASPDDPYVTLLADPPGRLL